MTEIDDLYDEKADELIAECLNLDKPKSFFLFAGAGSGKTRSLVKAIEKVRDTYSRRLAVTRQKVGVITYTNAAADEIRRRLRHDVRINVSTIHAFAWSLIGGYNDDIRAWLRTSLTHRLAELDETIASTKNTATKTYQDRVRSSASIRHRLASLDEIKAFVYSPTSDNRSRDSLNHSEVISITSAFLTSKPTLQKLLVANYPILLIDESQDTNRHLMDALLGVQAANSTVFCMGLLGDTMQRIYSDGKVGLGNGLDGWAFPIKKMNHRCPKRIIRLINRIRADVDSTQQKPRSDKPEGFVRLFAVKDGDIDNKQDVERRIAVSMADITGDIAWSSSTRNFKTLTLEHHMAAARFGFAEMFEPLYKSDRLQTSVLDGSAPGLRFFSHQVLPAVNALVEKDSYRFTAVVRELSPMLAPAALKAKGEDQLQQLEATKKAGDSLASLFTDSGNPTFRDVLINVAASGLFTVPEALIPFSKPDMIFAEEPTVEVEEEIRPKESEIEAWRTMLDTPFAQIAAYDQYVSGSSPFGTHQGVKGLEFPRVMVVISDDEARGVDCR